VPVVVAPGRSRRPGAQGRTTRVADAATCPFCEGHEAMTPPEVQAFGRPEGAPPDSPGWTVRVVPNKFPAIPGQEVVIHGPDHVLSFAELPAGVLAATAAAWEARRAAHADAAWTAVAVNEGPAAGASLDHSHSQIVPFGEAPPGVEVQRAAFAGECGLCAALGIEDARTVHRADGLRTIAPAWSRFAYELWIAPDAHTGEPGWDVLAAALADAARRLRAILGADLAWNCVVYAAPAGSANWHWHAEVWPRLTVVAAAELGAGVWINIVDPDEAAADLRAEPRGGGPGPSGTPSA
jgi:UDPglucose--hexose-1-phosphate uridylyltransferase